jgi:hypothetical protein
MVGLVSSDLGYVQEKISAQIATLPSLNKAQLLAIWAQNFSED